MVFTPTVIPTPAVVVIAAKLWGLVAGVVRGAVRHPVSVALVAALGLVAWLLGWRAAAGGVLGAGALLGAWAGYRPESFMRWVGWQAVAWWRWLWVYRRHWGAALAVSGLTHAVRGRTYVPDLVRVKSDATNDRVHVKLLAGQEDGAFAERSANLAHAFGAVSCRVGTPRPGWVVLTFPRHDRLVRPIPARPIPLLPRVDSVDVGVTEDGRPYRLQIHGTHVLLAGATGAGKGSWLWGVVRGLLPAAAKGEALFWACDPKRMELSYGRPLFDRYAATGEECAELLEAAVRAMQERADRYAGLRRDHVPTPDEPLIVVLVDELAFLSAYQTDRSVKARVGAALATLLTQGRAVGVSVVAALQDPRKEVVGIRNLFPHRVALRLDEPDQVDLVLGDGARDRGAAAELIPHDRVRGAGIGYVRVETSPEPVRVRAGHVTDQDIRHMVLAWSPDIREAV
ncbi:FtsK/SpoIIIE domain-containing protein [Sinosporangium siamense]|uniref:FtsK/SpoIIIE domain-containing protein n=1 Tax=Sinosporangium siamense TaxID=1367973 RepID=UPI0023B29D9C|nr:FtsK/SpoIIIE domain-containing protein [Sinosporangium siamense]